MNSLPIKGWPVDVLPMLSNIISEYIKKPEVNEFYIGRTNNLDASKSRHSCDEIFELYETKSADNAIEVEDILIKTFFDHPKCSNDVDHSGGGASDDYINYVYIAVWFYT
jgi:hypothetical protein